MSVLALLDEAHASLRGRADLAALALIAVLPGRFVMVEMVWSVISMPADITVHEHLAHLQRSAWWWLPLWLGGMIIRQMIADALLRRAALRLPPLTDIIRHLALVISLAFIFWASLPTLIMPLLLLPVIGLAAAVPGRNPWRALGEVIMPWTTVLVGLAFLALLTAATANVLLCAQVLLALAAPLLSTANGLQAEAVLASPLAWFLAIAIGSALIEPAWIATAVGMAQRARARRNGDDLLARLEALTSRGAA